MQNLELGVYNWFQVLYDPWSGVCGSQDPRETVLNLVRPRVGMLATRSSGLVLMHSRHDWALEGAGTTLAMMCHSDDIVIGEREVVMTCFQCCEYGGYGW